jgi:gliding motility-associated-like protein
MLKKLLSYLSLLMLVGANLPAWGQRENTNWYFGANAAVNFPAAGTPAAVAGSVMNTSEACASVSDAAGQLLFYTNSETLWNRANQVMVNGANLGGHNSCSQGALAVQNPGNNQQYYVFVLDAAENLLAGGLKYSLVDMTRQAGLGEVIQSRVQVSSARLTEKITAVPHPNGRDTWIVVHGWQTDIFYAYLLTPTGLQATPVTTAIGSIHSGGGGANANANSVGYMRVSLDGRKLAVGIRDYGFELFDFDPATGKLANYIYLQTAYRSYGVEFSLNSRLLYGTDLDGRGIYQYDLQAGSASAITTSGLLIANTSNNVGAVQAGPDGKLYVSIVNSGYLAVINNPNVRGAGCGFREDGVYLGSKTARTGLPNFYAKAVGPVNYTASIANSTACAGTATSFTGTVQPAVSGAAATWNFGDPASGGANTATGLTPTHTYAVAGTYQVTLTVAIPGVATPLVATQAVVVLPLPQVNLGSDVVVCARQYQLAVGPQPAGSTYRWQDGSTSATYLVQASGPYSVDNGRYSVTVTSAAGCTSTAAVNVTLNPVPVVYFPPDTTVCAASVVLRPRAITLAGSTYRWQDGSTGTTYLAKASGRYTVAVTTGAGCTTTAAVNVTLGEAPLLRLPADTAACSTAVLLRPNAQPASSTYRWQDGSTSPTYSARASGRYSVTVTSAAGCTSTAAVNVTLNAIPSPRLPGDTVACAASVLLRPGAQPAGSTYRWQDGSTSATYLAQASGLYTVVVTTPQGCTNAATGRVRLGTAPRVSLGADTTVCPNATWVVRTNPQPAGTLYRWQDGSTAATYLAHGPGQYSVEVRATATGCPTTATRVAKEATCPIIIPNIITPNGDQENEFFVLKGLVPSEWHLVVFDRWGRQVYDRAHYDNGWNALGQASGVYYYLLSNEATGARYRGWVEVARGN